MAKKEEIKQWRKANGYTKEELNAMWEECCKHNTKCDLLRTTGKGWRDLPLSQIQKIPSMYQQYTTPKEEVTAENPSLERTDTETIPTPETLPEEVRLLQKIKNKENLSEREIRSLLNEYGTEVDEIEGDTLRWVRQISTIVELCGEYVRIDWFCGLTEMQENSYDYQPYLVKKKERVVTVTDWVKSEECEKSNSAQALCSEELDKSEQGEDLEY